MRMTQTVKDVVTAPQGVGSADEIAKAEAMVAAAQAASEEVSTQLESQRQVCLVYFFSCSAVV